MDRTEAGGESVMSQLIYDLDSHQTIGVVKREWPDPYMLLPTDEDKMSIRLQHERLMQGHKLRSYTIPNHTYDDALALFHNAKPEDLDIICRNPPDRDLEEQRLRATQRLYRTQAIPSSAKERVIRLWGNGKGKSLRRISREVGIAKSTVQNIIKKEASGRQK